MFKITDENYKDYKQVFDILWKFNAKFYKLDPNDETSPIIVLNNWEKKSKPLAKKGLKAGLIDSITMSLDMPTNIKKEIDDQLITHGLPTFNQLVFTIKDTLPKILKRGKITNLDEYYILKELIDDSTSDISEAEKKQLFIILSDFETNYK